MLTESADVFGDEVAAYRGELFAHCYRMLGGVDEAEDALQEALTRAWQGRHMYREAISFRAWLYRIATNTCLNVIAARKRDRTEPGPCPDELLTGIASEEAGPEARYAMRESVSLAFLTVLQVLPPRQRAVLLLRDVLAFRGAEVARLLETSVQAVNSSLQRARSTLRGSYSRPDARQSSEPPRALRPGLGGGGRRGPGGAAARGRSPHDAAETVSHRRAARYATSSARLSFRWRRCD